MKAERRTHRVRVVKAGFAVTGAVGFAFVVGLVLPVLQSLGCTDCTTDTIGKEIIGSIKLSGATGVVARLAEQLAKTAPFWGFALLGAAVGWWRSRKYAEPCHDRFFLPFDDDVLRPIGKPLPYDPLRGAAGLDEDDATMPWTLQPDGARAKVWSGVLALTEKSLDSKHAGLFRRKPVTAFGWTMLVGPPGLGKSRLAVEIANQLQKRDGGFRPSTPAIARRFLLWWRLQVRLEQPLPTNPWDAGWLLPGLNDNAPTAYPGWRGRRAVNEAWLTRLAAWRPRRPTFLVLDDPRANDAEKVIETLEASAESYLHCVRLLIVNPTALGELALVQEAGAWASESVLPPLVPPAVLPEDYRFGEADIRAVQGTGLPAGKRYPLPRDDDVRTFGEITNGVPLLVELGLKALRSGSALETLTEDRLLVDRVDRVIGALENAGLKETKHHRAIAVATLAGGAFGEVALKSTILEEFDLPFDVAAQLARIYPGEPVDLRNHLPPIRPQTIGDAFVRRIVEEADDATRRAIVTTAWKASPFGTLRAALRLGGRADALGALLAAGPPSDIGLDPKEIALAYAHVALRTPPSRRSNRKASAEAHRYFETAADRITALDGPAALAVARTLVDVEERPALGEGLRWELWAVLVATALGSVGRDQSTPMPTSEVVTILERLIGKGDCHLGGFRLEPPDQALLDRQWQPLFQRADFELAGIVHLGERLSWVRLPRFIAGLGRCLANSALDKTLQADRASPQQQCRQLAAVGRFAGFDADLFRAIMERLEMLATGFTGDLDVQRARAKVHAVACDVEAPDSDACAARVRTVDSIAAAFPDDRDMQLERAWAQYFLAYSTMGNTGEAEKHARAVDAIVAPFPSDRGMLCVRANAWRAVAYVTIDDAAARQDHVQTVDAITAAYPDDRDMQLERIAAWRDAAYEAANDAEACEAHARTVDGIAARFADSDRDMQVERARARASVAVATTSNVVICTSHAHIINGIAERFPDSDRDLKLQRAVAWRNVAYATRDDATTCERHARTVERIVASLPGEHDAQMERAAAWRFVCYATQNSAGRETYARVVDEIAAPFPDSNAMQLERARAWGFVAHATTNDTGRCQANARVVDEIAARFGSDPKIQEERAIAWRVVAFATTTDAAACEIHARTVDSIAAPFPDDRRIQVERARAWCHVAHATVGDAAICEVHARTVDRIAARFPGDPDMQSECDQAWSYVRATNNDGRFRMNWGISGKSLSKENGP